MLDQNAPNSSLTQLTQDVSEYHPAGADIDNINSTKAMYTQVSNTEGLNFQSRLGISGQAEGSSNDTTNNV